MKIKDAYPATPQRLHAVAGTDIEADIPYEVYTAIQSWDRTISNARSDLVPGILREAAKELFGQVRAVNAERPNATLHQSVGDALYEMGKSAGIEDNESQRLIGEGEAARPASDRTRGVARPLASAPADDNAAKPEGIAHEQTDKAGLPWLDMSSWDHVPVPERQWAIRDRMPLKQAGLFSGEGGTGKSIIEMMKDVAHVAGKDWFGSMPEPGPAFYLGAEDDEAEMHIRFAAIAKHYGVTFKELVEGGLKVLPLLGKDATLCAVTRGGRVEVTDLYRSIYEAAGDIKPKNISVDTLSRAFAGNEIDRVQVYAFAMHMQALAMVAEGSVTVLSHPSLAGINSGTGLSGSTAWHGAFRFRQYLKGVKASDGEQPESDLRELEFKKNQYGPLGESIVLRYQRGLFLPEAGVSNLDRAARTATAEDVFLELLRRFSGQTLNVSHKPTAQNFAPTAFAKEDEATKRKLKKSDFEQAMRNLFAADKIGVHTYGRPSRPYTNLIVK